MNTETPLPELGQRVADVVRTVMDEARPKLVRAALSGERGEGQNKRHSDNFLSVHDLWAHGRYRELMREHIASFVYASEEAEPLVVGKDADPDLVVLVDPLDTSELAVRGLHGYTHVLVYSRSLARPVVAVVGDIFHHVQMYLAVRDDSGTDRAYAVTADSQRHRLDPQPIKALAQSLVTNYMMRPAERFLPLARQERLLHALGRPGDDGKSRGRIGVDFGSVGLGHIAAGFTDAMVEFAKGFAIWDLSPGHYVLHAAGGVVIDLNGEPIPLDYGLRSLSDIAAAMNGRRKFIAAGSAKLAHEILAELEL
ncbi:MAG TPA: inositol monophosphatase family protein [Mycobacterium sp.]|uniref:inositol monophosphatase family protein n=1 Tax=Mycobacterium sp. TaxID=1785 RepID=UPI002D463949|nr:inositol monophosphatase family protein [Mycobacterium sp.]HZU48723.1 inositol monophosphatase family protein [Mycobacterium sp.]